MDNVNHSCLRWLDQLGAAPVVLEPEEMAIHLRHLHHRALRRFWQLRRKSCDSWCKLSSSGVGTMLTNHKRQAIRIFLAHSPVVHQGIRANRCGRLDSHTRIQVFSTVSSLLGGEQSSLCCTAASRPSSYVVGSLPRHVTG